MTNISKSQILRERRFENLTYASLMTLAYFRQSPVTRHASVTLEAAHAWPALALTGFWVAGI